MNTVNTQAVQETAVKTVANVRLALLKTMFGIGRAIGQSKGAYEVGEKQGKTEGKALISKK